MTKQWNFYDSGGVLRKVKTPYFYDSGGVLRKVKGGYFYDSAGVLRQFFSGAPVSILTGNVAASATTGATPNANYGLGLRSSAAFATFGTLTAPLCVPGNPVLPFTHESSLSIMGDSGAVVAGGQQSGGTGTFGWAPASGYATPWLVPNLQGMYLVVSPTVAPSLSQRTAEFGSVDFGDGVGPRLASESQFFSSYSGIIYFNTWWWPQGAGGYTNGQAASLIFDGPPENLPVWGWDMGGALRSVTSFVDTLGNGTYVSTASTGPLYAPVGSNYFASGQGTLALTYGVAPVLGLQAIHYRTQASGSDVRFFTNEVAPWTTMPKIVQLQVSTTGTSPFVMLNWVGSYRMGTSGAAIGQMYQAGPLTGQIGSTNAAANKFKFD